MLLHSHLCIQVLVEFGCHFCKRKTLVKKKKNTSVYQKISIEEPNTLSFFLQFQDCADEGRRLRLKAIEGKSPWIHKIIPVLNRSLVFDCLVHALLIPALKFGPSLNCAKQEVKELVVVMVKCN